LIRTARWLGLVLIVVGGCITALGFLGDMLIEGAETRLYADPRTPVRLEPGSHPVDWVGPAKGALPFPSEVDVELRIVSGDATWRESSVEQRVPIGSGDKDQARSPIGAVEVLERSVVSIDFDPRVPTDGAPRILVNRTVNPPPETRSGRLMIGGVITMLTGLILRSALHGAA
jgi:hypothetical protein